MEKFANYILREKIDQSRRSIVYRGNKDGDTRSYVIKVLKTKDPSPSEIARFKQEYELIRSLDLEGVIKTLDIISQGGDFALILEDFDGVSLKSILDQKERFNLKSFLRLSAKIAEILGNLHKKWVVHRDIKPHNIFIHQKTGVVKITNFGISALLTHENDEIYNPDFIAETLAYMSPEQTGRMNRTVDYRTDLYSLGITLYEILTGEKPFDVRDPMELIHSHIAVIPKPPARLDSNIPPVISDMIMKLLSKNPEERYQNSLGLLADLEECSRRLDNTNRIDNFSLASKDISIKFNIPQILIGREEELQNLLSAFERTTGGACEMMLILGHPGIGKSALIYEIQRQILEKRGYFIFGKYEQLRKDVPFSSIIQAFQGLIRQLLSESDERIRAWREKIVTALGPNAKVMTDVIPDVEFIIGRQPEVEPLGPEESQNRFNMVFEKFINIFTAAAHPLTIFLDDLQWADAASLNFIKTIMTGTATRYLLLIGAYRDNEVSPHDPLSITLDEIQKKGGKISSISLAPLNIENVNKMIVNVLRCQEKDSAGLAKLIHQKTGGNPFFVNQFLKNLYDSKIIDLHPKIGWTWEMDKIQDMQFTDNVVEFMAEKISKLPEKTRNVLKVCACIGNRFDLETLSIVLETKIEEVLDDISMAIREGLVSLFGNIYKFHHDRIQEAAYSLLTPDERERIHLKIGTVTLEHTPTDQLFKRIFYIVDQLNQGRRLINNPTERHHLARLNLQAGMKAKDSTAYSAAARYLTVGRELLSETVWETEYDLAYALYKELMECQYLNRSFEEAERLFQIIITHAKTRIDKAKAYNTMLILYTSSRPPKEAIELGLEALRMFGINLSMDTGKEPVARELRRARNLLKKIPLDKIPDLPLIQDQETLAAHEIMLNTGVSAYYVNPNLFALFALKGVNDNLKHGRLMPHSAVAFVTLANIIQTAMGNYELSYQIGDMALKLNEKLGNRKLMGQVLHIFAFFIQHWKKHIRHDSDAFAKVYELSIHAGDFIFAGHSITARGEARLRYCQSLDELLEELNKYQNFMSHLKDILIVGQYHQLIRWILTLKGDSPDPTDISGEGYDLSAIIEWLRQQDNHFGLCFSLMPRLFLRSWYGKYQEALEIAADLDQHIHVPIGTFLTADHYFQYSLVLTGLIRQGERERTQQFLSILRRNQRKMRKWASLCPENFKHKYDLVAAEMAAIKGCYNEAVCLYHTAIDGARQNEFILDECIACERLAQFHLSIGAREEAGVFIRWIHQRYRLWGAKAKVKDLEKKYPQCLSAEDRIGAPGTMIRASAAETTAISNLLDLSTVMQVSQVISSEIMLDRLLQKIMHMSITNAGAQRGYLLLESENGLTVEASEDVNNKETQVMQSLPLQECAGLCQSIIQYVYRTGESLILGDAAREGAFKNDPYVTRTDCKSILCAPLMNKGKLSGILYMENNLITNAFTPERLELLRIFSVQAAISIENARLFELATTDGLTKLYVHRYFQLLLDQEIKRSTRYSKPFCVIMMDIDNFKNFNDTYGHLLGDKVLREVAKTLKKISRSEDIVARYGGEEFVMILPETDDQKAVIVAEKIRAEVEKLDIMHGEQPLHVTISLGVAAFPKHAREKEALVRSADMALYTSKRKGKNCVSLSGE
jgi:diguanylate cyclase (GGDEF)-like protein